MRKLYPFLLNFHYSTVRPFFILLLIFISSKVYSQPGVLDAAFGNKGKVLTAIGFYHSSASDAVLQADGKIIVIAAAQSENTKSFALVRYNVNGTLDNTFGNGGILLNSSAPFYSKYLSLALQADEKIIVAGFSDGNNFTLSRYNNNGSIDNSFGVNGVSIADFNANSGSVSEVFIKPDGKIVAIGRVIFPSYSAFGMAQFKQDGSLDSTFGINGKVFVNIPVALEEGPSSIHIQSDGKLLMSGVIIDSLFNTGTFNDGHVPSIIRFTINGIIDSSFGTNGIVVKKEYLTSADALNTDIAVQEDGKILLLTDALEGRQIHFAVLHRLNQNGTPDNNFGSGGVVQVYPNGEPFYISLTTCNTVNVQPDNKILVSGGAINDLQPSSANFFLGRYNSDGTIDYNFGRYGFILTDFSLEADTSFSAAIQPDGKIVLVGSATDSFRRYVALARYEQNAMFFYNTLKGSVYVDANKNGIKDNAEKFFLNAMVTITKEGVDTVYKQALDGRFYAETDTGS